MVLFNDFKSLDTLIPFYQHMLLCMMIMITLFEIGPVTCNPLQTDWSCNASVASIHIQYRQMQIRILDI